MYTILYKNNIVFKTQYQNQFSSILRMLGSHYDYRFISIIYQDYSFQVLQSFFASINVDFESYPYPISEDSSNNYVGYFEEHPELDKDFINQQISLFLTRHPRFILYFLSKFIEPYIDPFLSFSSVSIDLKDFFFKDYHFFYLLMYSIREGGFYKLFCPDSSIAHVKEYLESLINFTYFQFVNNKDVPIFHRLMFFIIYHSYINFISNYINIIKDKIYNLSIIQWIINHKLYIYIESKPLLKSSIFIIPFTILLYIGYNLQISVALIIIKYYIGFRFLKLFLKWLSDVLIGLYVSEENARLWYYIELPLTIFLYLASIGTLGYGLNFIGKKLGYNLVFLTIQIFTLIRPQLTVKIMSIINWIKRNLFNIKY
jgi:hypothetical protein